MVRTQTVSDTILLLGDPRLYEVSTEVGQDEIQSLGPVVEALHSALMRFRSLYHRGRAIAAPQIGITKRIIYLHIDSPQVIINPVLKHVSSETIDLWDDCMSFPDLLVKVRRFVSCNLTFRDLQWKEHTWHLKGDLSELLQHEYDHLDGVLATMKALDNKSLALASQKQFTTFTR